MIQYKVGFFLYIFFGVMTGELKKKHFPFKYIYLPHSFFMCMSMENKYISFFLISLYINLIWRHPYRDPEKPHRPDSDRFVFYKFSPPISGQVLYKSHMFTSNNTKEKTVQLSLLGM